MNCWAQGAKWSCSGACGSATPCGLFCVMPILNNIRWLYEAVKDEETTALFLRQRGLLHSERVCLALQRGDASGAWRHGLLLLQAFVPQESLHARARDSKE
ncbi:hypothetical protein M513_10692 [Trichuris suis]|uniref:Uncharacterized protein n=1 Tax=Trichuris suis TaxID=68888 RepID=A0A085LU28_9BILA|nr:hypothetical protein M513_10692 [Trichuris suis]